MLYNNKNIKYEYFGNDFETYTKIDEYFNIDYTKIKNEIYIYVNDTNNIIRAYIFEDNHGVKVEIIFNKKKTIKELIEKYLDKVGHDELKDIGRKDEIQFIYNQKKLECDDNTILEYYFKYDNNPIIQVNDIDGMLMKPIIFYNITFKTSQGHKYILDFYVLSKIERIIIGYLYCIDHPELINNRNNIKFLYNGEIINEKITARKCFKNEIKPIILVLDTNNLLTNAAKYNDNNEIISGPKFNVCFQASNGTIKTILYNYGTTIDKMLKNYLLRIDHPELINSNNKISFSHGQSRLKFGDQTIVGEFFKNTQNHTIRVAGL